MSSKGFYMRDETFYAELQRRIENAVTRVALENEIPAEFIKGTRTFRDVEAKLAEGYREDIGRYSAEAEGLRRQNDYLQVFLGGSRKEAKRLREELHIQRAISALWEISTKPQYTDLEGLFVDNEKIPRFATDTFCKRYNIQRDNLTELSVGSVIYNPDSPETNTTITVSYNGKESVRKVRYHPVSLEENGIIGLLLDFQLLSTDTPGSFHRFIKSLGDILHIKGRKPITSDAPINITIRKT